jgi:hypothetical protein
LRGSAFGGGGTQLDPLVALNDPTKPLRSKLLAVPALRQKYLELRPRHRHRVARLERGQPMLKSAHDLIGARSGWIRGSCTTRAVRGRHRGDGNPLKAFIDSRRAFLLQRPRRAGTAGPDAPAEYPSALRISSRPRSGSWSDLIDRGQFVRTIGSLP